MNRTNAGANINTIQLLIDILIMALALALDLAVCGRNLAPECLGKYVLLFGVFTLIYILSNKEEYLYNVTLFYYLDRVHRKLTRSFLMATVATAALLNFVPEFQESRRFYFMFLIIAYCMVCMKLFLYRPLTKCLQSRHAPRTAFVGTVGAYNKFRYFLSKTSIGIELVGYIAMTREKFENAQAGEYIGYVEDMEELIRVYNLDQVYILQKSSEELYFTQKYVDLCIEMGVTVRLVVDFYKRRRANSYVSTVGTYPVITYHTITLNSYEQLLKRCVDILAGLFGCILSAPVMLVTAIAIKLDSPGPVLFKQVRVGQNGRHFKIYKFRSMYIDAEERKKELMAQNEMEGDVMFKMKDDPRITRVGKVIRKLSIDELPQFFNILGGSMSLVGTRPPTVDEVEKYKTNQWRRISIKPGLTGMWQVSGRSKVRNFDDIVEMDVEYIDNWSMWLDVKIILKTVLVLLKHDDAY
ncbi:MAG: sugar transferase [Acetatifactor sp.]